MSERARTRLPRPIRRGWLVVGMLAALHPAGCGKFERKADTSDPAPAPRPTFTLFALAEVRGQIGPCGCTSDPLGDIARTAKLISDARAQGPVLVVDAGSLLYAKAPVPPQLEAQEQLKADLLAMTYTTELGVAAIGLGPADLAKGADHVQLARQAANLSPEAGIATVPPKVLTAAELTGGAKVGVFGVIATDAVPGLAVTDPIAAGKAAVSELRKQGAQLVIGLIQAKSRKEAAQLMRAIGGIELGIAGLGAQAPEPEAIDLEPYKVDDGYLIVPANRGQVVARLEVTLRNGGPLSDAVGPAAAAAKLETIERRVASLDADLTRFATDPSADQAFLKQKQAERAELVRTRDQLSSRPLIIPATGSYFTLAQLRIGKTLACAPTVDARVTEFYAAAGQANAKAALAIKVPPPERGQPGYVGGETCDDCHPEAVEFWKKTGHARAWKTLVDRGQQFDYDCVGCHVTGWEMRGGANLGYNEHLRDVQCETCHGPGSIHVAKGGEEQPRAIALAPRADLCAVQCHTKEHSDTFELTAYMRDILGPGHGEEARKRLGDGPTGGQLRKAALDKAGRTLGQGCSR